MGMIVLSFLCFPIYAGDADLELTTTYGSTAFTIQNSNGVAVSSITSQGDGHFRNLYPS